MDAHKISLIVHGPDVVVVSDWTSDADGSNHCLLLALCIPGNDKLMSCWQICWCEMDVEESILLYKITVESCVGDGWMLFEIYLEALADEASD